MRSRMSSLAKLARFYWHAGVLRAETWFPSSASHDSSSSRAGRRPLIVTRTFGNGKVLFMASDGAWRWRKGVEDRYHYRFWGQWSGGWRNQRNMAEGQSMPLDLFADRPKQEEVHHVAANVMTATVNRWRKGPLRLRSHHPAAQTNLFSSNRQQMIRGVCLPRSFDLAKGDCTKSKLAAAKRVQNS